SGWCRRARSPRRRRPPGPPPPPRARRNGWPSAPPTAPPARRATADPHPPFMLGEIALEVVIIFLLLLVNGVFAVAEGGVVASRRVRLERRAERGDKGAAAALAIAREPSQFVSTVQVGITLVGVLAGAFGGARIAQNVAVGIAT